MNTNAAPFNVTEAEQVRVSSAQALASSGAGSVMPLIDMLTDPSWVVRRAVVSALSELGEAAVVALCEILLHKRDSEARIAAAVDALVLTKSSVADEVGNLALHEDPAIVADAAQILGRRRHQSAVPTLIQLTKHHDDNVAVGAIEALGRIGGRAAVEALVASIASGNFFRTFPAIDVLGRSGDPRAVEPLAKLLKNPSYLPEAARALGRSGERAAVKPLLDLLRSSSNSAVRVAAVALWDLRDRFEDKSGGTTLAIDEAIRLGVAPDTVRRLAHLIAGADDAETVVICKLLGSIGSGEAAPMLVSALDSSSLSVGTAAAEALKKIGKDAHVSLSVALREGSSARRKALLPVITRFGAATDVAQCLQDADREVRALACEALARIGNAVVVAQVFPLLRDTNMRTVHAATAAIQALGSREARDLSVEAAKSDSPIVRRAALRILSYFGDNSSLMPILDGLKDPDPRVREAALQGMPYLESPLAMEALLEAARSPFEKTRALAMRSLGQIPKANERLLSVLLGGLKDPDAWVRYYACQALGRLEYAEGAVEIAGLLRDEAGQVRVSAVEALSHLDSLEAHRALREAAQSSEVEVKRAAIVGLGISHRSEDLPVVLAGFTDQDVPTRLMALSALVSFKSPKVVAALSAAAIDTDEQVSSTAIKFLAARPEQEATETLVTLLSSDVSRERAKAALLLPTDGRIAGLLVLLEVANDELAPVLISILSRIDLPEARTGMLAAIKLNNVAARKAAASSLAAHYDVEMRLALKDAAENDADAEVRQICSILIHE